MRLTKQMRWEQKSGQEAAVIGELKRKYEC